MLPSFTLFLFSLVALSTGGAAQQCSASVPCSVGCCSQYGYCGFGDDFCGPGCKNNCNAQKQCDRDRPCAVGCCSKFGFCGLGQDFCGANCAYQCDQKAQCDPGGWGAAYVNHTKCPLNVCCSKFGFCGMTSEFCGDKTVTHQTCDVNSHAIERVVGYYEGWAPSRDCHRMIPENIPVGVYTHINFAFASIAYNNFQTIPSDPGDLDRWKRVMMLKRSDPNLKIWLAIGGWTFNDPDQITKTTFSDICSTTVNQDKFIDALVTLMTAFGFDGVDIDWEYPEAPDRSGRGEDYANFPVFIGRLRKALKNANSNWGISITLPASFWYLQHFDIVKLEKDVDWFNVMTYDMHGAWDLTTDWGKVHGAQINAHTNLTEIADGLDLLWRNNIDPAKVNLGLAFYGRSMTLASASCNQPGCPVASAGNAGECSGAAGVLLNTEIADIITKHQLQPTLDNTAAVKMITWGSNQWTSFDDGDTFKIKTDFAKSHCLGGVMVWAVSHDNLEGENAAALAHALGRDVVIPTTHFVERDTTNPQDQFCHWINCGDVCPEGFGPLVRQDKTSELMLTSQGCPPESGTVHTLCCPKKQLTFCQWRGFKNSGHCNAQCNSNEVQVGSTSVGCSRGSQAACCTTNPATEPWGQCKWTDCANGDPQAACPADYPKFVVASNVGFGGEQYCKSGKRAYCCKGPEIPAPFQNCNWYGHVTNLLKTDVALICDDSCPSGQILVAKSSNGVNEVPCLGSYAAYCCAGKPAVVERSGYDAALDEFQYYLSTFLKDPTCPADKYTELAKRTAGSSVADAPETAGLSKRYALDGARFSTFVNIMQHFFYGIHQDVNMVNYFDSQLVAIDPHLPSDSLVRALIYPYGAEVGGLQPMVDPDEFTADFLCNLYSARATIQDATRARDELCADVNDATSVKRRQTPPIDRLPHLELRNGTSNSIDDVHQLAEELLTLWKRRFSSYDGPDHNNAEIPSRMRALEGAVNGDLTLHYARWLETRYEGGPAGEVMLEVAYWIGPQVGTEPTDAVRARYTQRTHVNPQDRWVVFHLHIPIDSATFIQAHDNPRARDYFVGVNVLNAFHGHRVVTWTNMEEHVDGRSKSTSLFPHRLKKAGGGLSKTGCC
ncbi:glycoside hydrolase [Coniochaeta ligniaria NRRL 30616]|uniref:chitinase n=1 Tax=Coniochaeta ligniaria NRRL 30616 TaxID=1408157 RepID=A0A1J7JGH4_9PEZI|nr:glycoside hydrolase [Coniochaeta ligniaria NRRL 30616]